MAKVLEEIKGLESKQPLFREFCKVNNLHDGDYYTPLDYILYADSIPLVKQLEIIRKYEPQFRLPNSNL